MKIIKYIALLLFSFLWMIGCSGKLTHWLFEHNLAQDDYRYGDLYRFSNLPQFKTLKDNCGVSSTQKQLPIALTLMGDSFTEEGRIEKNDFAITQFNRFHVAQQANMQLDKSLKNVLVIETVERHFRERFGERYENLLVREKDSKLVSEKVSKRGSEKDSKLVSEENSHISNLNSPITTHNSQFTTLNSHISNLFSYNTERHQAVLFGYDFVLKIRELKAVFNEKVFNRLDPNVAVSPDKHHLLYNLDVKAGINSSFDTISDEEIEKEVANINATYDYYKQQGFDEVILSIIPNKTSIVAPTMGKYNHLVERIQQHPKLKMPIVDVYTPFSQHPEKYYERGDSHWNCKGKQIWVDGVNAFMN